MDDNEPNYLTRGEIIGMLVGVVMVIGGILILLSGWGR